MAPVEGDGMTGFPQDGTFPLRRFRIGTRLAMGFGSILLILVTTAAINSVLNDASKRKLINGLNVAEQKNQLAATMKSALLEGGISMRNIGIQSEVDAMQREHEAAKSQRALYLQTREQFVRLGLTDTEQKIFNNIARLDEQIQGPLREAIGQALAFNDEAASRALATRVDPLNQQAIREINRLVELQQAASHDILVKSVADDSQLKLILMLAGAAALGVGGVFAWVITRSISDPLREAVALAQKVAGGELTAKVDVVGQDEVSELMQALKDMVTCLHIANDQLQELSHRDGLTGVKNRAWFNERFDVEWRRALRTQGTIGLLMLDIDHFKNVNDTFGHPGGDACLKRVAATIMLAVRRPGDDVFRYGGEEFAIILTNTDASGAAHIGEEIRRQVEALEIDFDGRKIPVTVSVGVASVVPTQAESSPLLIARADKALYQAKHGGRNQVRVFEAPMVEASLSRS
jgi:diguanylate cyclase (GGDEF)-like protein